MPVIAAFSAYSVGRNIETALAGCPSWIEVGEAIVLMKRSNNGRQLPAEVVEGRASPKGKQPTNGRGSDAEPSCHVDPIGGCAPDRRWVRPVCTDGRPKGGARCVSSARRDLCGGRGAIPRPYRDHRARVIM